MSEERKNRKNLRLQNYDYNTPGAYFITFCTHNRKHLLSAVGAIHESPSLRLTVSGQIVERVIERIPSHLNITIDRYVIMPNHVHIIAVIPSPEAFAAAEESEAQIRSILSKLVGYIKMNTSKVIRHRYGDISVWQRGFYEHVIRNQEDYDMIAKYIDENPLRWSLDRYYTQEKIRPAE